MCIYASIYAYVTRSIYEYMLTYLHICKHICIGIPSCGIPSDRQTSKQPSRDKCGIPSCGIPSCGFLHVGFFHVGFLHVGFIHVGFLHVGFCLSLSESCSPFTCSRLAQMANRSALCIALREFREKDPHYIAPYTGGPTYHGTSHEVYSLAWALDERLRPPAAPPATAPPPQPIVFMSDEELAPPWNDVLLEQLLE